MTRFFAAILAVAMLSLSEPQSVAAQFKVFYFGVNGLTCSQCSRSVEIQLKKLPFVAAVQLDLEQTTGQLLLKDGVKVRPDAIARAIVDAGFSIRFLAAELQTAGLEQKTEQCFVYQHTAYYLQDGKLPLEDDQWQVVFTGPQFTEGKSLFWKKGKDSSVLPKNAGCRARDHYFIALKKL